MKDNQMTLTITRHTDTFSSSPQITPEDMPEIVALGFKTIINARPDNEGGASQPASQNIKLAAEKAGLHYLHIPITPGHITPTDVEACANFAINAPIPILGFCKTGMRATSLYQATNQTTSNIGISKQNWLMPKVSDFFKNKCLLTKLYRKLSLKQKS